MSPYLPHVPANIPSPERALREHEMGKGRRITTMADGWYRLIDHQPRPAPVQPVEHVDACWCKAGWACPQHTKEGSNEPTENRAPRHDGTL